MNDKPADLESYRTYQLMTELEGGTAVSQRELAGRLGIAVGLVNSYLKNFVSKGYVRVKAFPRNRYAYLLTPKGLAEKSRIAYQHLHYFTSLYTATRQEYLTLFRELKGQGVEAVVFCGVDEVAEIAYLSLLESGLRLNAVVDTDFQQRILFGNSVEPIKLGSVCLFGEDPIIITSLKRKDKLVEDLVELGVKIELIRFIG